jgi:adenylosuccinate synthase
VGPTKIDLVMGVAKAYTTRVGSGPFPTELNDEVGGGLQERGKEFGATTGRPRRCGWFDGVVVRTATRVNGMTSLAVTKLDVLDGCREVRLCTGYRYDGRVHKEMPSDLHQLEACEPVYETMRGWTGVTTGVTSYKKLPAEAKRYLDRIEELAGCRIDMISTGSKRSDTIVLRNPMVSRRRPRRS